MSRDVFAGMPRLRRLVFRAKVFTAHLLPPWLGRLTAYAVGTAMWMGDVRGRVMVRRNLAHFIPRRCPEALARAVRRSYIAFSLYLYESLRLDALPSWFFRPPHLQMHDPWGVFAVRPYSGPAILVTVHSNWELLEAVLHRLGITRTIKIIALSSGDPHIDALFERLRNSVGTESLVLGRAPLGTLRALKSGAIIGLAADRDYAGTGLVVDFAGEAMPLPLGPAALAAQTGAPIIPLLLARRGLTAFDLIVGKPLASDPTLPRSQQVPVLTRRLATVLARFIAAAPAQWVAFHDAWKKP